MRIKLIIEYRGTAYSGWQRQENADSIQAVIEKALFTVTGKETALHASGRTDGGVHALGQTAHFDYEGKIPANKFVYLLNDILPPDISILQSGQVEDNFHSRFDCKQKTYLYKTLVTKARRACKWDTHNSTFRPLNIADMKKGAGYLTGTYDFIAFCSSGSKPATTVRTIYGIDFECGADCVFDSGNPDILVSGELNIRFTANGFLYNMVRIITAQLLKIGKGLQTPEIIKDILVSRDRRKAREIAPPQGLYLEIVDYYEGK